MPTYVMLYNGAMAPGAVSHATTGGHTHRWEHVVYVLQGGDPVCEGKSYAVSGRRRGAGAPHVQHQWRNDTQAPMLRVTFNAVVSEAHKGKLCPDGSDAWWIPGSERSRNA